MARTCFTFLSENLFPTMFLMNLHQLVMAGTSYHANVRALPYFTDVSSGIRGRFMLRVPQDLLWNLLYHSYTDISPVKKQDFALSSVPWDFSVQLGPTGYSAAQFYHRVCQICPSRMGKEDMRIWCTWGQERGLHLPNVLRTPNRLNLSSLRSLGQKTGTSVELVHYVMAPRGTNTDILQKSHCHSCKMSHKCSSNSSPTCPCHSQGQPFIFFLQLLCIRKLKYAHS